jgi:hypothetical protein
MPFVKNQGYYKETFLVIEHQMGKFCIFLKLWGRKYNHCLGREGVLSRPIFDTVALFLHGFFTNSDNIDIFK